MFRVVVRKYSVGPPLSKSELGALLQSSHWSIKSLTDTHNESPPPSETSRPRSIDRSVLSKLLKISGLEASITPEREVELINSLKTQMSFIEHLYDNDKDASTIDKTVEDTFRLVVSDHQPVKPLTLSDLRDQISKLEPSEDKGETGQWDVVKNSKSNIEGNDNSDGYFTIKNK